MQRLQILDVALKRYPYCKQCIMEFDAINSRDWCQPFLNAMQYRFTRNDFINKSKEVKARTARLNNRTGQKVNFCRNHFKRMVPNTSLWDCYHNNHCIWYIKFGGVLKCSCVYRHMPSVPVVNCYARSSC